MITTISSAKKYYRDSTSEPGGILHRLNIRHTFKFRAGRRQPCQAADRPLLYPESPLCSVVGQPSGGKISMASEALSWREPVWKTIVDSQNVLKVSPLLDISDSDSKSIINLLTRTGGWRINVSRWPILGNMAPIPYTSQMLIRMVEPKSISGASIHKKGEDGLTMR